MTLDDLKNININDLASWPVPVKIGGILVVCVAMLFAGYWFLIQGELDEYNAAKTKEDGLRETFMNKKAMAINLPAYKQQMEEMQQTFGSLLRQLPNTTEVPDLLVDITQAGLGRGLEFTLFQPQKEQPKDFYAELPISIQVRGTYHELAEFVSDVAALPRIVTFGDISISGSAKETKLTMSAKAKTYRYLEEGSAPKPAAGKPRGRK
ncbi:MAG TPA: type 4a pilus biogenesis protein PilO [Gallionella sp.]|nr:type 4a pilus biogenesis protein PilO [Gallionella sp.]